MKIEAGKYYVTRGGDVVGPLRYPRIIGGYAWVCPLQYGTITVYDDGRYRKDGIDHPNDLIKEHVMPKFKVGDRVKHISGVEGEVLSTAWFSTQKKHWVGAAMDNNISFTQPEDNFSSIPTSLDLTKPVQTRDGRKVRVLCTDGPGELPVVGFIEGNVTTTQWPVGGEYYGGALRNFDLINTPATPRTFERWFNVYDTGEITSHVDRHDADDEIPWQTRIARKRVVFTEGEWDE